LIAIATGSELAVVPASTGFHGPLPRYAVFKFGFSTTLKTIRASTVLAIFLLTSSWSIATAATDCDNYSRQASVLSSKLFQQKQLFLELTRLKQDASSDDETNEIASRLRTVEQDRTATINSIERVGKRISDNCDDIP